jgi:hypothetical protein
MYIRETLEKYGMMVGEIWLKLPWYEQGIVGAGFIPARYFEHRF